LRPQSGGVQQPAHGAGTAQGIAGYAPQSLSTGKLLSNIERAAPKDSIQVAGAPCGRRSDFGIIEEFPLQLCLRHVPPHDQRSLYALDGSSPAAAPGRSAGDRSDIDRCVGLSGLNDAYVAMVALRGRPRVAGSRRFEDCENHFVAYAVPWIEAIPRDVQARGAHLWIGIRPRVPDASADPKIKTYQWNDFTSGPFEASDHGFDSTILCDAEGFATEGPGFNLFIVKDGREPLSRGGRPWPEENAAPPPPARPHPPPRQRA